MSHFSTEETLPTLVGGLWWWFLFLVGFCVLGFCLVWVFGFWVLFCVFWFSSPTNLQCLHTFYDDLGTPPTRRPHSWKKTQQAPHTARKFSGRAPVPSRHQGAHPTPAGKQQAPHTARKCCRQSAGAQPTPGRASTQNESAGAQPTPGRTSSAAHSTQTPPAERRCPADARVHPTPWQAASAAHGAQMRPAERRCPADVHPTPFASKCRTQRAKATGRAPVPSRHQGVHPTPWQASTARSTQRPPAERRCPADARAYIDPLASSKRRAQDANAAGRAPVPSRRQGVHLTPWQAASAARRTQRPPAERRCPADARAYIRPLGKQTQHANAAGKAPVPSRRQGVHPTPWQASAAHSTQMLRVRCCVVGDVV